MQKYVYHYSQRSAFWLTLSAISLLMLVFSIIIINATGTVSRTYPALPLFLAITLSGFIGAWFTHWTLRQVALFIWLISAWWGVKMTLLATLSTAIALEVDRYPVTLFNLTAEKWIAFLFTLQLCYAIVCLFAQLLVFARQK